MKKMACIIMAGGKSTRFDYSQINCPYHEKPLLPIKNNFMIDIILEQILPIQSLEPIIIATSPNTPNTTQILSRRKNSQFIIVETPGKNYHEDSQFVIKKYQLHETMIITADLPTISTSLLQQAIGAFWAANKPAFSVMIEIPIVQEFDPILLSPENIYTTPDGHQYYPIPINFIDGHHIEEIYIEQGIWVVSDKRLLYNINRIEDYNRYLQDFQQ